MTKLTTYLTVMAEIQDNVPDNFVDGFDAEEQYFAEIQKAMGVIPGMQNIRLVRSQIFYKSKDALGPALRACPFCGKIFTVHTQECSMFPCDDAECEYCEERAYRVICDPDNGGCGVSTDWAEDRNDAAEDWNRRADNG